MSSREFVANDAIRDVALVGRLKVLFVDVRDSIGGDGTVLLSILHGLNQERFAPVIACHYRGALYEEIKSIPGLTIIPLNFGTRDAEAPRSGLAGKIIAGFSFVQTMMCALRLVILIKRQGISVIHTNNTVRAVLITNLISRLTKVPYIYHAHSALHEHPVQKVGARQAACLLANSEYTATTYRPAGISSGRMRHHL